MPYNVPFATFDHVKATQMFKPGTLVRTPFGSMAKLVDVSEQAIVFVLKQILMCVDHTMETGYTTKLNLRFGHLKFADGEFRFLNSEGADTASTATSCNTEYRTNKRYLTNLRERPNGGFDSETYYSSVRDAVSSIVSGHSRTPGNRLGVTARRQGFFSP